MPAKVSVSYGTILLVDDKIQGEIDIVLLDIIMPDMGGGETFDHMKKINPEVKVIIISGDLFDSETLAILRRGCKDFIHKPFTMKDLSDEITTVLQMK